MVRTRKDLSSKKRSAEKPKTLKKKNRTGTYKGIEWESFEELAFLYWAFELKNQGYIKSLRRSESFLLCDSMIHDFVVNLKTKSKPASEIVMHGHSYTPEFIIEWDNRVGRGLWDILSCQERYDAPIKATYEMIDGKRTCVSYIEIKPMFDQNNMERLFKVNQKWMWQKHGIFVNLIKPQQLFQATFTPKEYLTTPTGKSRKLNWKPKNLFQFLRGE